MKNILLAALVLGNVIEALAVERYVNLNNPTPSAPYLTWATAANNIQAAIDAASFGDVITVTNGVYQTGASASSGLNRVSITIPLLVRSVNGPGVTIIDGGGTLRCVAVTGGSVLSGFTLTNGLAATSIGFGYGGGAVGVDSQNGPSTLTNCIVTGNVATNSGGGAAYCNLNNCVVSNNYSAQTGGGILLAAANNCTIVNNVARFGGGGAACQFLTNCIFIGNSATNGVGIGGGATPASTPGASSFVNCVFVNNRAGTNGSGGGFCYVNGYGSAARLYNCTFTNNSAGTGGGTYGGTLYDCVLAGNQATNGVGQGGGAAYAVLLRCLVLGNSAKLGGGVSSGYTSNCVIGGNSASVAGGGIYSSGDLENHFDIITNNFAYDGGGSFVDTDSSTFFQTCQLSGNQATNRGGAVYGADGSCSLYFCTVAGNSAGNEGGGLYANYNVTTSVIYHNSAPLHPNYDTDTNNGAFYSSCTTPMPANGDHNFTNDPGFANIAAGNFRLGSNSPCINFLRYSDPPDPNLVDLDGNPRVVGGSIDLGAYEFQTPASSISYLWLQQYGLPTDGSADHADPDGDHFDNWSEWRAGTSPLDAASFLKILQVVPNGDSATITWQSVPGIGYVVERSTNLTVNPAFTSISPAVYGSPDTNTTSFVDNSATGPGPFFYRVRVN